MKFSKAQIKLYYLFRNEYINNGYLYGGSFPMNARTIDDIFEGNDKKEKLIFNMIDNNILQIRNCKAEAYELTDEVKKVLLDKYNLKEKWIEKGPQFGMEIQKEINSVNKHVNNEKKIDMGNLEDKVTIPVLVTFFDIYINRDKSKSKNENVIEFMDTLNSKINEEINDHYSEEENDEIRIELSCKTFNVEIPIYHKKDILLSILDIQIGKLLDEISKECGIEIQAKEIEITEYPQYYLNEEQLERYNKFFEEDESEEETEEL